MSVQRRFGCPGPDFRTRESTALHPYSPDIGMGGRECRRAALYHDGMNSPGELKRNRVLFAGRTTVDALYWLDELPREDTKVFARAFRIALGGPACNAAIAHAALGGRATLLSAVGRGPWAELVRRELKRHGIALTDLAAGTDYETP